MAVPLERAQQIFTQLVSSKTKKGYLERAAAARRTGINSEDTSRQKEAILQRLENEAIHASPWPKSRIIWRVGELRLKEAEPHLLQLNTQSDMTTRYSLVWALGRMGSEASIPVLEQVYQEKKGEKALERLTLASLLQLLPSDKQGPILDQLRTKLHVEVRHCLDRNQWDKLQQLLLVDSVSLMSAHTNLPELYLLSRNISELRPVIRKVLDTWSLTAGFFKYIRSIFKLTELLDDGIIWGQLVNRIESSAPCFSADSWRVYLDNQWVRIDEEIQKPTSRLAFSKQTRAYLRRRIIRRLHRLGQAKDPAYVSMAAGILLGFQEGRDAKAAKTETKYHWESIPGTNRWQTIKEDIHYEENWHHLPIYHILYGRSKRFELDPALDKWLCTDQYQANETEPEIREESYPELWDEAPEMLIQLLFEAESDQIRRFAKKAFLANPHKETFIDISFVLRLLAHDSIILSELGLELAKAFFDPDQPDPRLILGVVRSPLQHAREQGMRWAEAYGSQFIHNPGFASQLIAHRWTDVHTWLKDWMRGFVFKSEEVRLIIREVVSTLLNTPFDHAIIRSIEEVLWLCFGSHMALLDLSIILPLIQADADPLRRMGANLLLKNEISPNAIPNEILSQLFIADSTEIQAIAIQILGKCSTTQLWERKDVLLSFCTTGEPKHLEAVQPLIGRLVYSYPDFARQLVDEWVPILLQEEAVAGAHTSFFTLLSQELIPQLSELPISSVLELLQSDQTLAQRLGAIILSRSVDSRDLSIEDWVDLASHELLSVRTFIWDSCQSHPERIRFDLEEAIRMMESSWEDTLAFAFFYFDTHIPKDLWTPEILVWMCDSVHEALREFGRKMIKHCFKEQDGVFYLEHLSEHPAPDMQRFATHFLDTYASGKSAVIPRLLPYFRTLLSQPNKNKVGWQRVIAFIDKEARKSPEMAELFIPLLHHASATSAIGEKARYLEILLQLKGTFPHLDFPIHTQVPKQLPHAFFI